jgi:hypothetical protein
MFILRLGVSLLRRSFTGKEEKRILGIKNILNAFTTRAFRIFLSGIY